ncbi:MAG: pyridoxamine 5'-phosphate oxidase [Alphaproteobacteria bacterium]|jgi:pyridoxamine 5'-phosphate oxidase|nr:pyridoxamine 5'-phosphate oxidase [Alphaproteobacteria bacterium]MDP6515231.1 pyridoxamine 5'-phosphate oxidase [Alphaproteobacteria bacterium]
MSIPEHDDPIALFHQWLREAEAKEPNDPSAMCLATVAPDGMPSARMVLLKAADRDGFLFYTNMESQKGSEILANPQAALCFHWKSLRRQVRVQGPVTATADADADAYFATRPREAQIGAWASIQSRPLEGRFALGKRVAAFTAKFGLTAVPRPDFWSGFRVRAQRIEFWQSGTFRMHDRLVYEADGPRWRTQTLYP